MTLLAAMLMALVLPGLAQAQATGGIEGRVTDQVGRPLAGVEVSVARPGAAPLDRTMTDAGGAWRITRLEPGAWRVLVRRPGYRAATSDLRVESGSMVSLTVALEAVPFSLDSLVVSAPALSLSTTDAEMGSRLTVGEIGLLPTTTDVRQLITLIPGARPGQIWGGASEQANAYALDGSPITHIGQGGAFLLPSPAWIETLEVRGLGAGAEVGDLQGGLVEVTTLSGGNVVQGALRTGFESHRMNGSNLIPGEIGGELSNRWEVDGQLRGPVIRDRLHYAVFGHVIRQEERVLDQLAGDEGAFTPNPVTGNDQRWLGKLSWRPGERDLVQWTVMGRHQQGERTGQTGYERADATERFRRHDVSGGLVWQRSWSARSALTARVSGYRGRDRREPYAGDGVPGIEVLSRITPPRYQNAPFRIEGTPSQLGVSAAWNLWTRLAGLEHELIIGAEQTLGSWRYERIRNGGMTWRPVRVLGFDPMTPSTWVFTGSIGTAWGGEARLDSDVRAGAVFVQDRIRLASWLRLNPGLRFAWWSGDLTTAGGTRFTAVRDQALAPRVGLVADLDRRGGFVARAHWGRYHQPMFAGLFDRADGADVFNDEETWSWLGPAPDDPAATWTRAERDALAGQGLFRLDEAVRLDQTGRVEHYRQPYVDQTVLALERTFGGRWKAGVAYVHRRNRSHVALVDRNLEANYTILEDVVIRTRFGLPVFFGGRPLVLDRLALSNEDIKYTLDLLRRGLLFPAPGTSVLPPGMTPADVDALTWDPDLVLTTIPEASRRFDQFQFRLDARYRTWWAGASGTITSLDGNYNVVTGPDDYTTGGPGPWVRPNEQVNYEGALANQSRFEVRLHLGGLLPAGFRGGAFLFWAAGDRVTPTLTVSTLLGEYAATVPRAANPAIRDTVPLIQYLLRTTNGHRIFIEPRGTYRYEQRASLDLHLERGITRRGAEVMLTLDAFNALGDRSVTAVQTEVNASLGLMGSDYARVRGRVPPRTLRVGAAVRF